MKRDAAVDDEVLLALCTWHLFAIPYEPGNWYNCQFTILHHSNFIIIQKSPIYYALVFVKTNNIILKKGVMILLNPHVPENSYYDSYKIIA